MYYHKETRHGLHGFHGLRFIGKQRNPCNPCQNLPYQNNQV
jgi:hypothetical protein